MFAGMSLKGKLFSGFGAISIFCAIVGVSAFIAIKTLSDITKQIATVNLPSLNALQIINEAQTAVDGQENALLSKNISGDRRKESLTLMDNAFKRANDAWKIYEPLPQTEQEAKDWKEFVPLWEKWVKDHEEYLVLERNYREKSTDENYEKMSYFALVTIGKSFGDSEKVLGRLIEINDKGADEYVDKARGLIEFFTNYSGVALVLVFIAIGLAFFLGVIISNQISKAILAINVDLTSSSGQVASASEQLSSASQMLSNASSEQASSIEETSASLEEMNGMIENNLKSAEKSKELADAMKGIAERGNESMSELVVSMQEILDANANIEKLVKVIGEIGDKTKVIDEIVFQTKLLSFNASVEAERAGEHGRGFAVVAQEVGNLAQMSGKAALEISGIVKDSIKNAEAITTENKKKVEKGNELVKSTAVLLKESMEKASVVSVGATQVVDASKEQASGIRQISNAMDQLNKATQQNAATAEEAASSSEELSAQAETLNDLVFKLNEIVLGDKEQAVSHSQFARPKHTLVKPKTGLVHSANSDKKKVEKIKRIEGETPQKDEWERL